MSVWDINEWLYQPTKWCTLTDWQDIAPPESFGYLGCRATGATVPLLAEALVTAGRRGMTVESRNKFVKATEGVHTVQDLLQKVLDGYPEDMQNLYRQRWEEAEKARKELAKKRELRRKASLDGEETAGDSESNAEEVPDMMANLSAAALDGMDADNSKELEKEKKNMQEAKERRAKRYMREKLRKLRKSEATGCGAKQHQSNMRWARQYLPQDRPSGIAMSFNRPPHRGNWVARYQSDQDPPLKYDGEYDQPIFPDFRPQELEWRHSLRARCLRPSVAVALGETCGDREVARPTASGGYA